MNEAVISGLFAMAAAILAVAYHYWQFRRQLEKSQEADVSSAKKEIIEKLIAYRFVLLGDGGKYPESTSQFNSALSAIPIHFSHNKECIDKYRSIGDSFTADEFYDLIIALMKDVPLGTESIDKHLLENVPRVTPKA